MLPGVVTLHTWYKSSIAGGGGGVVSYIIDFFVISKHGQSPKFKTKNTGEGNGKITTLFTDLFVKYNDMIMIAAI